MIGDDGLAPGHVALALGRLPRSAAEVCNVGHLPTCDQDDLRATVYASLKIMEELAGNGEAAEGFATRLWGSFC